MGICVDYGGGKAKSAEALAQFFAELEKIAVDNEIKHFKGNNTYKGKVVWLGDGDKTNKPRYIDTTTQYFIITFPGCESLSFEFDEDLNVVSFLKHPDGFWLAFPTNFCKTQYGGVTGHLQVCLVLKLAEKYVDFEVIEDATGYYNSQDMTKLVKDFEINITVSDVFRGCFNIGLEEENKMKSKYLIDRDE